MLRGFSKSRRGWLDKLNKKLQRPMRPRKKPEQRVVRRRKHPRSKRDRRNSTKRRKFLSTRSKLGPKLMSIKRRKLNLRKSQQRRSQP